jgi:hypothetical protein
MNPFTLNGRKAGGTTGTGFGTISSKPSNGTLISKTIGGGGSSGTSGMSSLGVPATALS